MAVNDEQMLPQWILNMEQMQDLQQSEGILLDSINAIIKEMYRACELITYHTVTSKSLEEYILKLSGTECSIEEYPEKLLLYLVFDMESNFDCKLLVRKLNDLIPAHLKFLITLYFLARVEILCYLRRISIKFSMNLMAESLLAITKNRFCYKRVGNTNEQIDFEKIVTKKNYWTIDGSYKLNQGKKINAKQWEENI